MADIPQSVIEQITAIQWVAIVVVFVLAINGLATLLESLRKIHSFFRDVASHLKGRRLSDAELKSETLQLARQLMDFVQARQTTEPSFSFEQFHESSDALIRHSQETQNLYARDFAGKVGWLRQELSKLKLQDEELDQFYEHPTNYIGLRILAMRLAALGERVRAKT